MNESVKNDRSCMNESVMVRNNDNIPLTNSHFKQPIFDIN